MTAREMFEELGYTAWKYCHACGDDEDKAYDIKYVKDPTEPEEDFLFFHAKGYSTRPVYINLSIVPYEENDIMLLAKAINKQIEELGWLE